MSETQTSWSERLLGGFRKTSERLSDNLAGLAGGGKLSDATLDDIEAALIVSDLGPSAAGRIREKLAEKRFGDQITQDELKLAVAEEIAEILRPVAKPTITASCSPPGTRSAPPPSASSPPGQGARALSLCAGPKAAIRPRLCSTR